LEKIHWPRHRSPAVPSLRSATHVLDKLALRRLVQAVQDVSQFFHLGFARGEARTVGLPQGADEGVAVLLAYLAVLVAVTGIEAGLRLRH
jgi:hypothetical protein